MLKSLLSSAVALTLALPAFADISVADPYARAAGPTAKAGAAFMVIENTGDSDDRLVGAASDIAARVELHTHKDMGEGVMRMMQVEEGFAVPAGGTHALARGGDHVMFMGLKRPMNQGDMVTVTLTFEKAGDIEIDVPVDLERQPGSEMQHDSADHGDGMKMDH
ncbi:copper chaperone PCu(A)C [Sagittula sp. NFXS13]|uniref:copper chaperone PCu(A)C n=1 Tax=Sagittula sp. NFXS13 TaxID=2819095 RepID=UPI0032DE60BF